MNNSKLNTLPLKEDFETVGILKALSKASRALAELNMVASTAFGDYFMRKNTSKSNGEWG